MYAVSLFRLNSDHTVAGRGGAGKFAKCFRVRRPGDFIEHEGNPIPVTVLGSEVFIAPFGKALSTDTVILGEGVVSWRPSTSFDHALCGPAKPCLLRVEKVLLFFIGLYRGRRH